MTPFSLPLGTASPSLTLRPHAVATFAVASYLRPPLVIPERDAMRMLELLRGFDVTRGGRFQSLPTGAQVWSGPWHAEDTPGDAQLLGTVDWTLDSPIQHYTTITRATVTEVGVSGGATPASILASVLGLVAMSVEPGRLAVPLPPPRDPFRSR